MGSHQNQGSDASSPAGNAVGSEGTFGKRFKIIHGQNSHEMGSSLSLNFSIGQ